MSAYISELNGGKKSSLCNLQREFARVFISPILKCISAKTVFKCVA